MEEEREQLARNPNTPAETLDELSRDKEWMVRMKVAGNINTPVEVLDELSRDKIEVVRIYVAKNSNVPIKILDALSQDEKEAVIEHRDTNTKWKSLKEAGLLDVAVAASKYLDIVL